MGMCGRIVSSIDSTSSLEKENKDRSARRVGRELYEEALVNLATKNTLAAANNW